MELFLNKLVICVSNEISNVRVGFAKEITYITQSQVPMLVVQDIVSKELVMPFGKVFNYTKQKFDALNSLDPNARLAILYENCFEGDVHKNGTEGLVEPEKWADIVNASLKVWFNENEH